MAFEEYRQNSKRHHNSLRWWNVTAVFVPSEQAELWFGDLTTGSEARRAWHDPDPLTLSAGLAGLPGTGVCDVMAVWRSRSSWQVWELTHHWADSSTDTRSYTHQVPGHIYDLLQKYISLNDSGDDMFPPVAELASFARQTMQQKVRHIMKHKYITHIDRSIGTELLRITVV